MPKSIHERVEDLKRLVEAETAGDGAAHHSLLKGIRELQQAVETPIETASRLNFQVLQNICLRIGIERGLLQALASHDGNEAMTAGELHQRTQVEALLIVRVMRVLSAIGFAAEAGENSFTANELTRYAISSGAIGALKHHFDLDMAMGGRLVDYMRRPVDNTIHQFAGEPEGNQTLFDFALGHPTIFGLLSSDTDKGREQKKSFDDYMASKRPPGSKMQQWFDMYPASERLTNARRSSDSVLMVDIGGGPGQELVGLKERFPQLQGRLVLQDLPVTLDRNTHLPDGIEKMPYDFFTPQPVIGARIYFLRDITHNWSDTKCTQILQNIAAAMEKGYSTLLIDQYVLPSTDVDLRAAEMDILMMLHTSGIERTIPMCEALFFKAGLQLVKIWPSSDGRESVLEVEKA